MGVGEKRAMQAHTVQEEPGRKMMQHGGGSKRVAKTDAMHGIKKKGCGIQGET